MEFAGKYIYLIFGILLFGIGIFAFFSPSFRRSEDELDRELGRFEYFYLLAAVSLVLGVVLLRQAYVMFFGISRSLIF